jgi:hypothetical protein
MLRNENRLCVTKDFVAGQGHGSLWRGNPLSTRVNGNALLVIGGLLEA